MSSHVRTITFPDTALGQQRFELFYTGLLRAGNTQERKPVDVLRREIKIFDALDAISVAEHRRERGVEFTARVLRPGGGALVLEHDAYTLAKGYLAQVPWPTGADGRKALDLIDWFDNITPDKPNEEPAPQSQK